MLQTIQFQNLQCK